MFSRTACAVVVALAMCLGAARAQQGKCTRVDDCKCVYDDGFIVDLHPLASTDGNPKWANQTGTDTKLYSWNPCIPFTYLANHSECISVAVSVTEWSHSNPDSLVCMINPVGIPRELIYDLGSQESAEFVGGNDSLTLEYTADKDTYQRVTKITLRCTPTSKIHSFITRGETDANNTTITYEMVLASKHACAQLPNITPAKETSSSLSGGTIFLIVVLVLIATYLILGVTYQTLVKNETGLKRIPNHAFWFSIPTLVKSGCQCMTRQNRKEKAAKYDSI